MAQQYEHLLQCFSAVFPNQTPLYVVRVPGRVNLIGEHTDYNGLPVMPMAIEREVRVVVAPRNDKFVQVANTQSQFDTKNFELADAIPAYDTGDWGNYIKAGVQGIVNLAKKLAINHGLQGFSALIDSDLPMAAGLSSSSAMVVASGLACMVANRIECDRAQLAEEMATAERYVGTMGGGMDQAAVLLAQVGSVLKIDFFPVRTVPVTLPDGYSVAICNSMVVAPKTATARLNYNRRPIECRLATALLAKALAQGGVPVEAQRLSDLMAHYSAQTLLSAAEALFGEEPWSKDRAAQVLGLDMVSLDDTYFQMRNGQILPEFPDKMPLLNRVRHVLSESERVEASVKVLQAGDAERFGTLMNESHASCRDWYGISCDELEQLVSIARGAGAVGSRLTGAGFGGCTVSLVPNHILDDFKHKIISLYYEGYLQQKHPDLFQAARERGYSNIVIVSSPCNGAETLSV